MADTLIAKPVVMGRFWIVSDGKQKVGNVLSDGSGYEVKINGSTSHFDSTKTIKKNIRIEFQPLPNPNKSTPHPFDEFPVPNKIYNSIFDLKRKIHLFTKTPKSRCYYAAGWFSINFGETENILFCPKYIFIQRYPVKGPFKTKAELVDK